MRNKRTLSAKELEVIMLKLKEVSSLPIAEMDITLDQAAFLAMEADFEKYKEFDIDAVPVSAPVTAAALPKRLLYSGTRKVTIRIPNRILNEFNARAAASGKKYQTLMVTALAEASLA